MLKPEVTLHDIRATFENGITGRAAALYVTLPGPLRKTGFKDPGGSARSDRERIRAGYGQEDTYGKSSVRSATERANEMFTAVRRRANVGSRVLQDVLYNNLGARNGPII